LEESSHGFNSSLPDNSEKRFEICKEIASNAMIQQVFKVFPGSVIVSMVTVDKDLGTAGKAIK
jgi:hypothetical protein